MKQWKLEPRMLVLAAWLAAAALGGCEAQGGGNGQNDGTFTDGDGVFPNDGTTTTSIDEGGNPITGNFICEEGVSAISDDPTTQVITGGLVGGPLTAALNRLGATTATTLLNSVTQPELLIDNNLSTFSTFSLTLGLLGVTSTVDELVLLNKTADSGNYAVFGVSFPAGTLEVSLINSVVVRTYLNGIVQETLTVNTNALDLLGLSTLPPARLFLGVKTTMRFDAASIGIEPGVISADVGDAMHAHELCTRGHFVTP